MNDEILLADLVQNVAILRAQAVRRLAPFWKAFTRSKRGACVDGNTPDTYEFNTDGSVTMECEYNSACHCHYESAYASVTVLPEHMCDTVESFEEMLKDVEDREKQDKEAKKKEKHAHDAAAAEKRERERERAIVCTKEKIRGSLRMGSMKTVSPSLWGCDHWSTLAYIETVCCDHKGVPNSQRMRCNSQVHPGLAHECEGSSPTRLRKGERKQHDDWSCCEDFIEYGLWSGTGLAYIQFSV